MSARRKQPKLRVAFQGEPGAYSEQAVRRLLGDDIETVPLPDFASIWEALREGGVDRGLLPVENSLAGTGVLQDNWDVFAQGGFHVVAEAILQVHHCLLAPAGTKLRDIISVRSHPQALQQCRGSLRRYLPNAEPQAWWDTAGAAKDLAARPERGVAAIASRLAGEIYGLDVLREGMEDDPNNYTRFLLASCEAQPLPSDVPLKTSLVFALKDAGPGSLFRAMGCFALRDVDLARIESRPIPGTPWRYRFFIDVFGGVNEPKLARALEHLSEMTSELSIIGSYPASADWMETKKKGAATKKARSSQKD